MFLTRRIARVRGTVERSYRVSKEQAVVDPAARAAMTREDRQAAVWLPAQ